MSDEELQLKLVPLLAGKLSIIPALPEDPQRHFSKARPQMIYFTESGLGGGQVRPSEWLRVCELIRDSLDLETQQRYVVALEKIVCDDAGAVIEDDSGYDGLIAFATWQQQARAIIAVHKPE